MSKKFSGIFAVIILSIAPFCSFAQEGVLTQKQEGNTNNIYYTIGGANTSAGIDCFDYYRFGRKNWISILVNSKNQKYKAGDTIKFVGQISNESNLPMLKLGIYAQLYRANNSLSAHRHGDYLVDEFFALENISMNASTTKTVEFEYKIPNGLASGRYVLGTSIVEDRKFNMSGVPFLEGSYQGRTFFEIDNKENNECFFEREKIYINDILYKQKDVTPDFQLDETKEYIIKYSLKNSSENEQVVSIKKTLYKWDNYSEANKIDQKIDEISIRGDAYTLFEDKLPELKGGVYLYEVIAQNDNFKSILKVRWAIHDSNAPGRINFSGLSKFPLKEGDNAFIFNCFQSVSDYFRYSGKIVSVLKDKKGFELAKTEYQSDDITSNIMAQKMDFQAVQDYNDLILETTFYDKNGNIIDKSVLNYDCSSFSSVLEKLKLEVKNGELIIKPYDICGNQAESKLSIEVKDSEKKPFYVESIPPTKELRKKLDFTDGETYQIFAMANMKVAAKMQYTHHAIKNNNMIAYIVLGILAILLFMFITKKMKKNNSQVSMFILLGLFLFPFLTYATAPSMPTVTGPSDPIKSVPATGSWNAVSGATNYKWEIRSGSCSGILLAQGEASGTSISIDGNINIWNESVKYLCVKACNGDGCSSVGSKGFTAQINPTIQSPINGGNIDGWDKKLDWSDVAGVSGYKYQICSDSNCSTVLASGDVPTSEIIIKDININNWNQNNYYWRVKSCAGSNYTNCMNNFTNYSSFVNKLYPNYQIPNNGSVISSIPLILDWTTTTGSNNYQYEICRNNRCSDAIKVWTGKVLESKTNLYFNVPIWDGATYYWRIKSCYDSEQKKCSNWGVLDNSNNYRSFKTNLSPKITSPESKKNIDMNDKFSWGKIDGMDKYEIKFYSSLPYDSGKACGNDSCSGAAEIYSTSTNSNSFILNRTNIWSYSSIYYTIRACRSTSCTPWSYKTYAYTYYYPYNIKISSPYPKINSLPSPPNGIDILSPPIIFDWEKVSDTVGYQYYIKNNKTGERKEYATSVNSVVINFEDNIDSKDWFHQSDDRGYEWGVRFCTSGNLNDCGNANSSPWTTASNFSVQKNLIKDSIKIDTQTAKRILNVPTYYNRIIDPLNNRRWNDVFLNANLTSIFTSNPQLVDFDTEQESSGNDFTIPVGEKLRLKLNKPDIENSVSWVIRGGAIDEPPAYWVDDAKKIYDNLTPLPAEYLYESTVNLGSLGTYYPKIGMAVTDPSKDWDKVEVKAFNASDCNNGDCSQAGESDTIKIEKDDNGYYITGQQEGIVYLQVKINDLDTVQTMDNKWFEMGKINSEMATFVIIVDGQVPLAEAGNDKTTFSESSANLDGSVLYQDSLQPSEQIVKLMVPNPEFDPSKLISSTNQPEIEKDYKQITNYFYQYEWSCEKGSVENQNSLNATFKAPKIDKDTDVKCFLTMKVFKTVDLISVEDGSLAPGYPKPPELVQTSTDHMTVKVLYNQQPEVSDLSNDPTNGCNSGATISTRLTWKYTDNDPAQKAYQIKIIESGFDTGKINSESNSYLATGLEYDKTYTWELIAWDQNDVASEKKTGSFFTPKHRYPSVDFSFSRIEDPDNKDIIKYKFTSNVTTYDDTPKAVLKWNFGDGSESIIKDPEHIYATAGNYTVKLEATDGDGNMCFMEKDLQAQDEEYIYSENPDIEMFNR